MSNIKTKEQILAKIDTGIDKFHGAKGYWQGIMQDIAKHIAEHGDWTLANTALERMNAEERNLSHEAVGCIKWLHKYVGLEFDKDTVVGWKKAQFIKDNYADGVKNPYWTKITVAKVPDFNLDAEIAKLVSRANSAMKKDKVCKDGGLESNVVVSIDHLTALKAISSSVAIAA